MHFGSSRNTVRRPYTFITSRKRQLTCPYALELNYGETIGKHFSVRFILPFLVVSLTLSPIVFAAAPP